MDNQQAAGGIGAVTVNVEYKKPSDVAADAVLTKARAGKLAGVVVLGYDAEGQEYIDCNIDDGGEVLWLLHRAIHLLVSSNMPK